MKFKTKRDSETGKKFAAIDKKIDDVRVERNKLLNELGVEQFRPANMVIAGGISSLLYPDSTKVPKHMIKSNDGDNEYTPCLRYNAGKALDKRIEDLPVVSWFELNMCIGHDDICTKIGFASSNPEYYLFATDEEWGVKIPSDCEEITTKEYNTLSEKS